MADKVGSKDLTSIFDPLKPNLTKATAVLLEDIFKRILGDMGFTASSFSITAEGLLESISESLLGKHPTGPPESGSVSRIAGFVAGNIIDNVLDKLHSATQTMYSDVLSKDDLVAGCKEISQASPGKPAVPDLASWVAQTPPSSGPMNRVAEEMVQMITNKLELFAILSRMKLMQFKLLAETKAIGLPREQLLAAVPLHGLLSEATGNADACKPDSKTVSSSEKKILQWVEDVINSVLSYILKQTSQEQLLPPRESSILLHLMNDVLQSFRAEKPKSFSLTNSLPGVSSENFSPPVQSRVGLKMQGGLPDDDAHPPTVTTEKETRKPPCSPISHPGMAIFEAQEGEITEPFRTFSSVTREQKVLVMEETQDKAKYESSDVESPQRTGASPESFPQGREMFLGAGEKAEPKRLEKTESGLENLVQDAIFTSLKSEPTAAFPAGQIPDIGQPRKARSCIMFQALRKMEDSFLEEELPLVVETLLKLFDEIFQHIRADEPKWPPPTLPSSFAHLTINRHQQEKLAVSKEHVPFNSQSPISDAEVNTFAGRLVKTIFQKLSLAILADADSSRSEHTSLAIANTLPLEVAAGTETDLATAHFKDPAMSLEQGTSEGGPQPTAEDLSQGSRPKTHGLLTKTNLACDLVEACLAKVHVFVAAKAEPQFCSHPQDLNLLTISGAASTLEQDVRVSATVAVSQKRASRFEKVFKALSRAFSRTSPRKRDKPATDRQKPAPD